MKETHLENLSDRLNYALQLTGTKKADLARAMGVKAQIIQFLCSGKTKSSRFTFEIATVLGLNTRWLAIGEGTMFIADDPHQQFLKTYKAIPLLSGDNIKEVFLNNNLPNPESIQNWFPLKTEDQNIFAIKISDTAMEPYFPAGSYVFLKKGLNQRLSRKYVFAYLAKFDTFVVRELIKNGSNLMLLPKNKELFNEVKITDDIYLLGIVTDCFWHIGS